MKIRKIKGGGNAFFCPGCSSVHHLVPGIWSYNGNPEKPTFAPSVLFRSGHFIPGEEGKPCWCTYKGKLPPSVCCSVCHSFVRDGQIQFLGDCTHALAGKTVEIPEWPYAPGTYGGVEESQ